jgi:type IX secretion system PorP/SprF family membrane protein
MKNILYMLAVVIVAHTTAFAQQDPHFTQYFDNTLFVNPAYAGSKGVLNITGIHREQWVGFEGRPRSTTLSMHTPLSYESVGLGFTMVNDQAGPVKQTMFYGDFSYSIKFRKKGHKLAFGVKAGVNLINIGTTGLETTSAGDPKLLQNVRNSVNPNVGVGIYYHTPSFFIGASTPKMIENSYSDLKNGGSIERRHYFGIIGGVITLSRDWKLRPTSQVKITEGAPISVDASIAGIYSEKFWIGAMYRLDAAFGAFVQYQLSPQFKLGVATDFGTQQIRNYNYGTFELLASYDFVFKKQGIRSPRYF